MSIVVKTPPCGIPGPVSRHTVRLCETMLIAVSRAASVPACSREGNHPPIDGERVEVMLGWPFTSAQQQRPTSICLSTEEALRIVADLKAALRRLAAAALDDTLDVSALALWSSITNNSSRSAIGRRESVSAEMDAMRVVVNAYTAGGGVWPGTAPIIFRPSVTGNKVRLTQRVLRYLKDSGESGRVVFRALLGDPGGVMMLESETTSSSSSPSSARTKLMLCAQSASSPPPRFEEASTPVCNTMAETTPKPATITTTTTTTTSRIDLLCIHGRDGRSPTNERPAKECGSERCHLPQVAAMTSESNKEHEGSCNCGRNRKARDDGSIAAAARSLAEPEPVEGSFPPRTGESPPLTDAAAAEADSISARRHRYRSPEQSSARTLVHSGKEGQEEGSTAISVRVAATSCEKSAAVPPPPRTGSSTPSSPCTAGDAVKSERPSPNAACEDTAALASPDHPSSPAEASRGRHRKPSSPRGRPSVCPGQSSPFRAGASSSPSSCASESPVRRRGSAVPSSPRAGGHSRESEGDETAEGSLFRSPPPPNRQRSCYYGLPGLTDSIFGGGSGPGAFWNGGNARRSTNSSYSSLHAAVNSVVSCSNEPLAGAERGTPPEVSSSSTSSSSSSSSAHEQNTTTTAAAATDETIRKKARRVSWSPMVIAREEAAAYIRPRVKRYIEVEEVEYRAAYTEVATGKFVRRRVEERAERKRGEAPAVGTCRPAAQRGAFFGLLAGLYRPELMGWKLWTPDHYCALMAAVSAGNLCPEAFKVWRDGGGGGAASSPPGRVTNLGDLVRTTAANMRRRCQSRA